MQSLMGLSARNRQFRWFLLSRTIYAFAVSGLPALLAVSVVGGGGGVPELAWVLGVGALPAVGGAMFTPSLLRCATQKALFQWTCAAWILITLTMSLLDARGRVTLWALIGVSFLLELVGSTLYPAIGAYLPQIVDRDDLKQANAERSVVVGAAGVIGPAVTGALAAFIDRWMVWGALAVLITMAFVLQSRLAAGRVAQGDDDDALAHAKHGWRFFKRSPGIVAIVLYAGLWHLLAWSAFTVAGPWLLDSAYNALWAWGVVESLFAAGLIVGGFFATRVRGSIQWICIGSLFPLLFMLLALALQLPLWVLLALALVTGAALTVSGVHWATKVQEETPDAMIPSVFSFDYLLSEGIAPFGYLLMPLVLTLLPVHAALLGIAAVCLLVGIVTIGRFPTTFVATEGR